MPSKNEFIQDFKRLQRDLDERIREIEEAIKAGKINSDNDVINELNALKTNKFKIKEYLETLLTTGENRWTEIRKDLEDQIKDAQQALEQTKKSINNG
jgi:hypothetical protein